VIQLLKIKQTLANIERKLEIANWHLDKPMRSADAVDCQLQVANSSHPSASSG